jgi:PBSX family phage portal protein
MAKRAKKSEPSPDVVAKAREFGVPEDDRMAKINVHIFKADGAVETTALNTVSEVERLYVQQGGIPPPYDPLQLVMLFEHSNSIRQNVDAYATNIDGFGHSFDPVVDLEADDTEAHVRSLIIFAQRKKDPNAKLVEPSADEIAAKIKDIALEQSLEGLRLNAFFRYASLDSSFVSLRRRTRQDVETTGNGYWEVLRNLGGKVAQFNYLPAHTIRLLPLGDSFVECKEKRLNEVGDYENAPMRKRFRTFIQRVGEQWVYFKEYGDPRCVSNRTGQVYANEAELLKKETSAGVRAANEIIHFKVHSARSSYGVPRWIGNLLSVLGSRSCEEVNYAYFENKSVPPMAILVSGGRLAKDSVSKLESYIKNEIRGKDNFHKILIIEAESPAASMFEGSGQVKVELKPLTEAQAKDGLFQNYDERNVDKVGMAFRLPRMLRGDTRDFNRSTAQAALVFAEGQVFEPERQDFDYYINRYVMPELDVRHWLYRSGGPIKRDPEALAKMIHDLQDIVPPEIALELAEDVFDRNFSRIKAPWGKQPLKLTIAQIATANNAAGSSGNDAALSGDTPSAEDTNPDNQAPNNEPNPKDTKVDPATRRADAELGVKPLPGKRPRIKKSTAEGMVDLLAAMRDHVNEAALETLAKQREDAAAGEE